jgi:23S rRNA pseudouridine2605 synthase/16S rRNA pseudouridine516 synthase
VASRRASDRLIQTGKVEVNGAVVTHPGTRVEPGIDRVCINGEVIHAADQLTYVLLNKPHGYLVSAHDPHHGQTIYKLLAAIDTRIFPVGRLDLDTWGVLLLTSDGDLAFRLTHPRYGVEKVYRALVSGCPSEEALKILRNGVALDDGPSAPAKVRIVDVKGDDAVLELVLHEGRKRQVKRMFAAVGHRVRRLTRTHFAGLTRKGLKVGQWRHLTQGEVKELRESVGLEST